MEHELVEKVPAEGLTGGCGGTGLAQSNSGYPDLHRCPTCGAWHELREDRPVGVEGRETNSDRVRRGRSERSEVRHAPGAEGQGQLDEVGRLKLQVWGLRQAAKTYTRPRRSRRRRGRR